MREQVEMLEEFRRRGVVIVDRNRVLDPSDETGEFMLLMEGGLSQLEVRRLRRRVRDRHQELAEGGWWKGGKRPYGYRHVRVNGWPSLEIIPEEAEAIREAAGRILSGEGLRTVTRRWNAQGLRTPWGREWHAKAVKQVLTSPVMAGLRRHTITEPDPADDGYAAEGRKRRRRRVVAEREYPARWAGILDRRTWRRLVAEFERRAKVNEERGGLPRSKKYLLTGLLVCSGCGEALIGHPTNGSRSYFCNSPRHPKDRPRVRVQAEPVEEYVLDEARGRTVQTVQVYDPAEVAPELREALDRVQERLDHLNRKLGRGEMDDADYATARGEAVAERDRLEAELAERTAERGPWADLAREIEALQADPDVEIRAWLDRLVAEVVVLPVGRSKHVPVRDRVRITWRRGVRRVERADEGPPSLGAAVAAGYRSA